MKFTITQEHTNALSALLNNSQAVNLMNGFISDLSDAAMEVLKEAQVLFTVLLFSCIQVVQCLNKFASLLDLDNRLFTFLGYQSLSSGCLTH